MNLKGLVVSAALFTVVAAGFAQEAPAEDTPVDTQSLEADFDALFGPTPDEERAQTEAPGDAETDTALSLGTFDAPSEPAPAQEPPEQALRTVADQAVQSPADAALDAASEDGLGGGEEAEPESQLRWGQFETATLRGLDKITGRFTDIEMAVGTPITFGTLEVEVQTCFQTPPDLPPESSAFIRVKSLQPLQGAATLPGDPVLFSGWMFASSPGLNALEHPVYDVWVIECAKPEPPALNSAE
ncbi:MAG: DUF2155 domain-containing protein [Pseudomonadota bacterium]